MLYTVVLHSDAVVRLSDSSQQESSGLNYILGLSVKLCPLSLNDITITWTKTMLDFALNHGVYQP